MIGFILVLAAFIPAFVYAYNRYRQETKYFSLRFIKEHSKLLSFVNSLEAYK